jgi:hypothetical protein
MTKINKNKYCVTALFLKRNETINSIGLFDNGSILFYYEVQICDGHISIITSKLSIWESPFDWISLKGVRLIVCDWQLKYLRGNLCRIYRISFGACGGIILTRFWHWYLDWISKSNRCSIVSFIATSSGAAVAYIRDKITISVSAVFEVATTLGAISGAYWAEYLIEYLYLLFGLLLLYSALMMLKNQYANFRSMSERTRLQKVKLIVLIR